MIGTDVPSFFKEISQITAYMEPMQVKEDFIIKKSMSLKRKDQTIIPTLFTFLKCKPMQETSHPNCASSLATRYVHVTRICQWQVEGKPETYYINFN